MHCRSIFIKVYTMRDKRRIEIPAGKFAAKRVRKFNKNSIDVKNVINI